MKHIKTVKEHFGDLFNKLNKEINEALDNPCYINWIYEEPFIYGYFNIGDKEYKITCHFIINDFLTFKFSILKDGKQSTELVNDGSKDFLRVVPTIKEALIYLLDNVKPVGIIFVASDASKGRKMLYDRFISECINKRIDYNANTLINQNIKMYSIYSTYVEESIVLYTINFVIENMKDIFNVE